MNPLTYERRFADLDDVQTRIADCEIKGADGKVLYQQKVVVPKDWSDRAATIAGSKYLYGDASKGSDPRTGGREHSVLQLVVRVCGTIAGWGMEDDYFATGPDAARFHADLEALCMNQYGAFNSPVWFNVGLHTAYGISKPSENWRWLDGAFQKGAVPCEDAYKWPQGSACFIQSVTDDMAGIMALASSEATLFKYGSGTGTDLSTLRSSQEKLAGGGKPSGPVSFMRIYDAIAGVIKSGGKTRRAAKIQTLRVDHPDIMEFIDCKAKEDRKARALIAAGYSDEMTGSPDEAYSSVFFQNSNLSVRVTDAFMEAVETDNYYATKAVTTGAEVEQLPAGWVLNEIAQSAWHCGDPGLQYDDTINRWHTCPNSGRINTSNPCSEYMFLDDSACNLASLNLLKYLRPDGTFDVERFRAAVRVFLIAQEILVDRASYPTQKIAANSHNFRPLGLGYCNLGALLMVQGIPYDSDAGRFLAAAITALMHAEAYKTSARLAQVKGAFPGFAVNREPMLAVIEKHKLTMSTLTDDRAPAGIMATAYRIMCEAKMMGEDSGFRNAQVTLLAPTGTIAFMMDCDTTGIEPETALVKTKHLAGGGQMKIVNQSIERALQTLGSSESEIRSALTHLKMFGTLEEVRQENGDVFLCPLQPAHLPVFDTAFPSGPSGRCISTEGHLKMMAAVQPFLSGSISKTVNLPATATVDNIKDVYIQGWKLGVKSLAVYRDGSKGVQPLSTQGSETSVAIPDPELQNLIRDVLNEDDEDDIEDELEDALEALADELERESAEGLLHGKPVVFDPPPRLGDAEIRESLTEFKQNGRYHRERLPATRDGKTHKFSIGGHEGYLSYGVYPDGRIGELFIKMSKQGSTVDGLMDSIALSVSIGLQSGVPLDVFVAKFAYTKFEPAGPTGNPVIPFASSPVDYVFRWLEHEFLKATPPPPDQVPTTYTFKSAAVTIGDMEISPTDVKFEFNGTAPKPAPQVVTLTRGQEQPTWGVLCMECGEIMTRSGACWGCPNCFASGPCG